MNGKVTQASVHLRDATGLPDCGNCTMFQAPHGCTHVQSGPGEIRDDTLCDDYEAK